MSETTTGRVADTEGHDGHGHNETVTIIVNARRKSVQGEHVSFEQVVRLAFDNPPTGDNVVFTVTYRAGPHENPSGTLLPGQRVKIKDGMVFNVTATDKS